MRQPSIDDARRCVERVIMNFQIRPGGNHDVEELVRLSLLAWEPIFDSFRQIMGPAIYTIVYPDWQTTQRETVETFCKERENTVLLVAELDGNVVGFLVYELNRKDKTGEVQLLAVHPDYQNQGIGTELNNFALIKMKEGGMKMAVVGTGGDPGHAPARRSYEKAGYTALPLVRYYKDL
jgi:GNAT superfamily N-acetyltransferase